MNLPKFLFADNDNYPEDAYVVHTQSPCFILNVESKEYQILDGSYTDDLQMSELIIQALEFYESELDKYDDDDEY